MGINNTIISFPHTMFTFSMFKAAALLGMLLSVTAITPTPQQLDACWAVFDRNGGNICANDLREELAGQLSVGKATQIVSKFLKQRHQADKSANAEHLHKQSVGQVNCAAKQAHWAANSVQEGRLRRQAEAERAAELARLLAE